METALVGSAAVFGATVTFTGQTFDAGSGFGNVLSVLALQDKDKANGPDANPAGVGNEWGGVTWDGTDDVLTGEAAGNAGTQTRTVAELALKGIDADHFGVVFNISEEGNNGAVDLQDFYVVFQDASGAELFTAKFDTASPLLLDEDGQGTGSSGYLFVVSGFSASELTFFNTSTNRVGMRVLDTATDRILNVDDGPDSFFLAPAPGEPIPLPPAAWGGMLMLGAVGMRRWLVKRS